MPQTTRKDLERAIDEGGSVMVRGQHIFRKDDLPSEADLADLHRTPPPDGSVVPTAESAPAPKKAEEPPKTESPPKDGKKD